VTPYVGGYDYYLEKSGMGDQERAASGGGLSLRFVGFAKNPGRKELSLGCVSISGAGPAEMSFVTFADQRNASCSNSRQ